MKAGKAFEIFVKRMLMNVGFLEVQSDDLFVFDGNAGQMVQGLGEAHNADVLLEPPVQTPFIYKTRLLIEFDKMNFGIDFKEVTGFRIPKFLECGWRRWIPVRDAEWAVSFFETHFPNFLES